ncbi:hypothetical protein O6H91_09G107900 [Diphasiastrum complanatum]|uniref:Uncharacterized protein n=1 Tax=Diphasiastrum complanatum TaxID=34168 RepID=A0ACC2CTA4_DIPCM|nr:hypothetical protein O6H91_09G107900 [Diphasiastrum complanatum]
MAKRKKQQFVVVSDDDDDDDDSEEDDDNKLITPPAATDITSTRISAKGFQSLGDAAAVQPLTLPKGSSIFSSGNQVGAPINHKDGNVKGQRIPHGLPKSRMCSRKAKRRPESFLSFQHLPVVDSLAMSGKKNKGYNNFSKEHQGVDALWVDKYAPTSLDDLIVNSKKVNEVQKWLESHLGNVSSSDSGGRVLVLNGPAGSGKSAVVRVLARVMGFDLCEWATPAPVLWKEHLHNRTPGAVYMSKLDEFKAFLEASRKYPSLPHSEDTVHSGTHQDKGCGSIDSKHIDIVKVDKVLLIEDLPVVNDREHAEQLMQALYRLALAAKFPTIVKMTDLADGGRKTDQPSKLLAEVLHTLESGGARKITFNSITPNAIKRALRKVLAAENRHVSDGSLMTVAKGCEGDLRNALLSLQLICVRHHRIEDISAWQNEGPPYSVGTWHRPSDFLKEKEIAPDKRCFEIADCDDSSQEKFGNLRVGRDVTLSLFHALGKLLHNKRLTNGDVVTGSFCNQKLLEKHKRPPLNMAEPEAILSQAQLEADSVMAFLHENVLQFVDEEAIDSVAEVASYLSDADATGTKRKWHLRSLEYLHNTNDTDPSQLAEAIASSIAARGVLFANTHNPLRKWQSLRAPLLWQVDHLTQKKEVKIYEHSLTLK